MHNKSESVPVKVAKVAKMIYHKTYSRLVAIYLPLSGGILNG